jgi:hypothetical protein
VLVCKEDNKEVEVRCHAVVLTSACKYFHGMLLGDVDNEEKRTMRIVIEDASEQQMLPILKYIYTREFDVDVDDVIGVWILAHKFLLEDLQVECESMIMKNITKDNVADIKRLLKWFNPEELSNFVLISCPIIRALIFLYTQQVLSQKALYS